MTNITLITIAQPGDAVTANIKAARLQQVESWEAQHGAEVRDIGHGSIFVIWHLPCNSYIPPIRATAWEVLPDNPLCRCCGWPHKAHRSGWEGQRVS